MICRSRVRRIGRERHPLRLLDLALPVDRMSKSVQHATQQAGADIHTEGATKRHDAAAGVQPIDVTERHEEHAALVESNNLCEHGGLVREARDATELG